MNPRISPAGPIFQRLTLVTMLAILALVILGGVVRVTESGLGCPDWPLCHGSIIPPGDTQTLIEYSHRLLASVVGLLVLSTVVVAWIRYRSKPWVLVGSSLSLGLVLAQGALGGVTVITKLDSSVVTAHLALAEVLLLMATLVFLVSWRGFNLSRNEGTLLPALAAGTALSTYVLLLSGSYTTMAGASGACNDWPLCQGELFKSGLLPAIHMSHRYLVLFVGLLTLTTICMAWRQRTRRKDLAMVSLVGGVLFLAQIVVGAVTVWSGLSAEMRALHLAMASMVWMTLSALAILHYTPAQPKALGSDTDSGTLRGVRLITQ